MPAIAIVTDMWAGDKEPLFLKTEFRGPQTERALTLAQSVTLGGGWSRVDQQRRKCGQEVPGRWQRLRIRLLILSQSVLPRASTRASRTFSRSTI